MLDREYSMNLPPDLDARLDEALEESFPASDPPAVHCEDPPAVGRKCPPPAAPVVPDSTAKTKSA